VKSLLQRVLTVLQVNVVSGDGTKWELATFPKIDDKLAVLKHKEERFFQKLDNVMLWDKYFLSAQGI
jgi:hypothetical protein